MSIFKDIERLYLKATGRLEVRPQASAPIHPVQAVQESIPNRIVEKPPLPDADVTTYLRMQLLAGSLSDSRYSFTEDQIAQARKSSDPALYLASIVKTPDRKERKQINAWIHEHQSRDVSESQAPSRKNGKAEQPEARVDQKKTTLSLYGTNPHELEAEQQKLKDKIEQGLRYDRIRVQAAMDAIQKLDGLSAVDFFKNVKSHGVRRFTHVDVHGAQYQLLVGSKDKVYFNVTNGGKIVVVDAGSRSDR